MGPAASAAPTLRQDARRPDGIFLSDFEQGEIGPDLFRAACNMGLEGSCRSELIVRIAPDDRKIG